MAKTCTHYTHTHVCIHARMHTRTYACTRARKHTWARTHTQHHHFPTARQDIKTLRSLLECSRVDEEVFSVITARYIFCGSAFLNATVIRVHTSFRRSVFKQWKTCVCITGLCHYFVILTLLQNKGGLSAWQNTDEGEEVINFGVPSSVQGGNCKKLIKIITRSIVS